jgi:hypothetical protein
MFRLYNSHHQTNVDHRLCTYNVCTIWDIVQTLYVPNLMA